MKHAIRNYGLPRRVPRGFTLMELMIALVLTIVLMGGVMAVYQSGKISFLDSSHLSRIQENVRFASDYMIRDIRNAGFRDETFLRIGHEQQIVDGYARIFDDETDDSDVPALRIRYAGRGSCTEVFNEFRLVENEYSVNADGDLVCRGRNVGRDEAGGVTLESKDWDDAIPLVSGVTGIAFQPICPTGEACTCDEATSTCMGVIVGLEFEGLRALQDDRDFEPRAIEMTASFRNIILDRINEDAWGGAGEEEGT